MMTRKLEKMYAAVTVKKCKDKNYQLIPEHGVCTIPPNTEIAELPDGCNVIDSDGNNIKPTGRFYVTTETIDPYHLLIDLF